MSVTVLEPPSPARTPSPGRSRPVAGALAALGPFAALGLYGALRWGTILSPDPVPRLLGMLALSLLVASLGLLPVARIPAVAAIVVPLGLLAIIPLSGLPLSWVVHLRIAVTVRAIGEGLSGLPGVLGPDGGINEPIRAVIAMGAGVLLLDGALMLAFAPRSLGELRLTAAALPLVVLAVVPSALARPAVPYLHGLILFLLLAALVWGERMRSVGNAAALALVALAAVGAMLAAPAIDPGKPWVDFRKLAGSLGPGETFNWAQSYGPLHWPRTGHEVLQVQAPRPAYWKAEDLETFDGFGWVATAVGDGSAGVDQTSTQRWTESLHVTVTGMSSAQVIAAGVAAPPTHLGSVPIPGTSAGTWTALTPLRPGDSYLVSVYTPHPSPAQLRTAGARYPATLSLGYRSLTLPSFTFLNGNSRIAVPSLPVQFAPFHAAVPFQPVGNLGDSGTAQLIDASPYGRVYRLAHRLAAAAGTPYDFALGIERYLARGYVYDENPPPSRYPIESFLFASRHGYCQQFAGAMALLLRMGGVPARVSAGFTTGRYDSSTHAYSVTDVDAHAWVEAWFPHYGWVTFDPTPSVDPALGGHVPLAAAAVANFKSSSGLRPQPRPEPRPVTSAGPGGARAQRGSGVQWWPVAVIAAAVAILALTARAALLARAAATDPIAELERAFARSGRPLAPNTTLAALEHRYRSEPEAVGYIRSLRLARYGALAADAGASGRRALRAQLASGRGPFARLRAVWALPPAPGFDRRRRRLESSRNE